MTRTAWESKVGHSRQPSDISEATASTWSGWDSLADGGCWADACDEVDCPVTADADAAGNPELATETGPTGGTTPTKRTKNAGKSGLNKANANANVKPIAGDTSLPSVGSRFHDSGRCKPCAFFHTKGCVSGSACLFCHLCPPREVQRRKQLQRHLCQKLQMQMRGLNKTNSHSMQHHHHPTTSVGAQTGPGFFVPVVMAVSSPYSMQEHEASDLMYHSRMATVHEGMSTGYTHPHMYWPGQGLLPMQQQDEWPENAEW